MATVNITNRFLNENKVYDEGVVVTIPSVLEQGGGRSNADPVYVQGGDSLTAQVIEKDSLIKKAYLIVDEGFPAGATLSVDVAGTAYFTGVAITSPSMVVSTVEDTLFRESQTVTCTVAGVTGDVTTGKVRIVFDTLHPLLKNGQYAN